MIREKDGTGDEQSQRMERERKDIEMEYRRLSMIKRCKNSRHIRQMHIERREALEVENLRRAKEASEGRVRQIERTQRLAAELSHRKHIQLQESLKKKKAQSMSSCTLEKIETDLLEIKKREEAESSKFVEDVWHFSDDMDIAQQQQKKLKYKRELQNQLIDNRRRRREEEEEKHRERKILEEAGEMISKEKAEAENSKKKTALLLQAEREAFLKARQFWKDKRREFLKQEHDEISRIIADKEALQKKEIKKQTDTRETKDAVAEKLGKQIEEEKRKKMEREEIVHELYLAEKENKFANEVVKLAQDKKRKKDLSDCAKR
ncbi:uncharacterized protein LOC143373716 isoform X2 [Andrena cerasifolii]|uniref:uncharacterized protein LOC143373716 isoform X2 n=1 Tax=Andrena cerasifolii TaxID=2819439 RepID=UPI004037F66B